MEISEHPVAALPWTLPGRNSTCSYLRSRPSTGLSSSSGNWSPPPDGEWSICRVGFSHRCWSGCSGSACWGTARRCPECGRLEAVPMLQKLGADVEDGAYRLIVKPVCAARKDSFSTYSCIRSVMRKPSTIFGSWGLKVILQARQMYRRWTTQGDRLAVKGNITLDEPPELILHGAFLAGDRIGLFHLEVHFIVGWYSPVHGIVGGAVCCWAFRWWCCIPIGVSQIHPARHCCLFYHPTSWRKWKVRHREQLQHQPD